jgi:hypothetical protein
MATRFEPLFTVDRDGDPCSLPLSRLTEEERDQHLRGEYSGLTDEAAAELAATITPDEFRRHCGSWDGNLLAAYYRLHSTPATVAIVALTVSPEAAALLASLEAA